jgi:hypothetical protein
MGAIRQATTPATNRAPRSTNRDWQPTNVASKLRNVAILFTFLLGIGNFALHKAVLESRHRVVAEMPWLGKPSLALEFALLLVTLLLVANGRPAWGWAYLGYSALNGLAGWLILSRRL